MLDWFNNYWIIIISCILLFIIIRKIYNLNKPFDENRFIEQYKNQLKLKENFSLSSIPKGLPKIASYYVGLN
jgi:hypothetical protein